MTDRYISYTCSYHKSPVSTNSQILTIYSANKSVNKRYITNIKYEAAPDNHQMKLLMITLKGQFHAKGSQCGSNSKMSNNQLKIQNLVKCYNIM